MKFTNGGLVGKRANPSATQSIGIWGINDIYVASKLGSWMLETIVAVPEQIYSWYAGGVSPAQVSTIDRITYASDTNTATLRGPLNIALRGQGASGNYDYGWYVGGYIPSSVAYSSIRRIDYANDSSTIAVRGSLPVQKSNLTGSGNNDYGWFSGGAYFAPATTLTSSIYRVTYASDTSGTFRSNASTSENHWTSVSINDYSWYHSGPGAVVPSNLYRITFASDTDAPTMRGPLSVGRTQCSGSNNDIYGWFSSGNIGGAITTSIDRMNFTNDTVAAQLRGQLSNTRYVSDASGNSDYGWIGAGVNTTPAITTLTTVDRLDYANDNITTATKGPLTLGRWGLSSTGGRNG